MNPFGASVLNGLWILANAFTPNITTGNSTNSATNNEVISAGVRSWYLLRIPPSGRVPLD